MKIYAKIIKAKSAEGLTRICRDEISSNWGPQLQSDKSSFDQTVCVARGEPSLYDFGSKMRKLLGDQDAEIYKIRSGPQRAYFALHRLDQSKSRSKSSLAVFAIPEPIIVVR